MVVERVSFWSLSLFKSDWSKAKEKKKDQKFNKSNMRGSIKFKKKSMGGKNVCSNFFFNEIFVYFIAWLYFHFIFESL